MYCYPCIMRFIKKLFVCLAILSIDETNFINSGTDYKIKITKQD